jgi:dihydrofolate reductase
MAKLIYAPIASLDGYIEDQHGKFGWGAPDPEALEFISDLVRPVATYLYGRRMYETMVYWERSVAPGSQTMDEGSLGARMVPAVSVGS